MDVCIKVVTAGFLTTRTGSVAAGQQCAQCQTFAVAKNLLIAVVSLFILLTTAKSGERIIVLTFEHR